MSSSSSTSLSRCAICFDEDLPNNPVVKPCPHCFIECHKVCLLNTFSTKIIPTVYQQTFPIPVLVPQYHPITRWLMNPYVPFTLKLRTRGISNYLLPQIYDRTDHFPINLIDDRYAVNVNEEGKEIEIKGVCIHCKKTIYYNYPLKRFVPFKKIAFSNNIEHSIDYEGTKIKIPKLLEICHILIPLGIDFGKDFYSNNVGNIRLFFLEIFLSRNSRKLNNTSLLSHWLNVLDRTVNVLPLALRCLYYMFKFAVLPESHNFTLLVQVFRIFMEVLRFILYNVTVNRLYYKWTIEIHGREMLQRVADGANPFNKFIVQPEQLNFDPAVDYRKFISTSIDFRNIVKDKGNRLKTNVVVQKSVFRENTSCTDEFVDNISGMLLVKSLLCKCKPLIRFIYRIGKASRQFQPLPYELTACLEVIGYNVILLCRTVTEFLVTYNEYRNLQTSMILNIGGRITVSETSVPTYGIEKMMEID